MQQKSKMLTFLEKFLFLCNFAKRSYFLLNLESLLAYFWFDKIRKGQYKPICLDLYYPLGDAVIVYKNCNKISSETIVAEVVNRNNRFECSPDECSYNIYKQVQKIQIWQYCRWPLHFLQLACCQIFCITYFPLYGGFILCNWYEPLYIARRNYVKQISIPKNQK